MPEDLVNQTIFADGNMEILVIDSGSEQQESKIVQKFQNAIHPFASSEQTIANPSTNLGI